VRLDAVLRRVVRDASLGGCFEHAGEQAGVERAVLSLGGGAKNYELLYALPDGRGAWARSPFSR
jgi:hypothetical protein